MSDFILELRYRSSLSSISKCFDFENALISKFVAFDIEELRHRRLLRHQSIRHLTASLAAAAGVGGGGGSGGGGLRHPSTSILENDIEVLRYRSL